MTTDDRVTETQPGEAAADMVAEPVAQPTQDAPPPTPPAGWDPYAPPPAPQPTGWDPYAPPPAGWDPYAPPPAPRPAGWDPYAPPPAPRPAGWDPYAPPPAPGGRAPYGPSNGATSQPAPGASALGDGWAAGRAITHLWSGSGSPGVWVAVHGAGWKRLSPESESGQSNLTLLAMFAKNYRLPVSYHEDSHGQIDQLMV